MKNSFAIAKKKTPFQKRKEEEEAKKRKADEEAAKVYEEFVADFAVENPEPERERKRPPRQGRSFIPGGVVQPGSSPFDPAPTRPTGIKSGFSSGFDKPKPSAFDDDDEPEAPPAPPPPKKGDKDKPRQIDLMLERLKQEQQERDEREAARREGRAGVAYEAAPSYEEMGMNPGSFDSGDPHTTNLYLGNLAPDVDEQVLLKEFGRFGAIGSVKIMWPRDEEQRRKGRNCGFVAFMRREDAARALEAMDNVILHDFEVRVGWGKSVNLPAVPIWRGPEQGAALPPAFIAQATRQGFAPGPPGGAMVPPPVGLGGASAAMPWGSGLDRREAGMHDGVGPDIEVPIIEDLRQRFIIDSMAMYVQRDGCAFEQLIMEEEQGNPEYKFLFDLNCPEHLYYRWRVYSLAEGDTLRTWRIEPFVMVEGGQRWLPPSMTAMQLSAGTAAKGFTMTERTHGHERMLSEKERDKFEDMLRSLTVERADIRAAMEFALDCADAGQEIVETLQDALTIPETPIPQKIARLFLVSDILHNSTAPVRNASRYRGRFEQVLPSVFESLQETYRGVETRITQEALRRHVLRVLRCWREKFVFGDDYLNGLQATFLQPAVELSALRLANPTLSSQLEALSQEDLERKCRLSGLSTKGEHDTLIHRLLALDAYLNNTLTSEGLKLPTPAPTPTLQPSSTPIFAPPPPAAAADAAAGSMEGVVRSEPAVEVKPAAPVSRWTSIDEEEEKQMKPAVPISKWLAQEAEMERARQAAAAAAAAQAAALAAQQAAQTSIFPDVSSDDEPPATGLVDFGATPKERTPPVTEAVLTPLGAAAGASQVDERRRQKLRQVELACARLEAELEEQGLSRWEVEDRVAARRAELMADVDGTGVAGGAGSSEHGPGISRARRDPSTSSVPSASRGNSTRERDKERDSAGGGGRDSGRTDRRSRSRERKDSDRRRSRSRSRDRKDRDRDKERDKERDRERDSRDRDRDRDREKDRDRDREKDRDRDRDREKERSSRDADRDRDRGTREPDRDRDRDKGRDADRGREADRGRSGSKRSRSRNRSRSRSRNRSRR